MQCIIDGISHKGEGIARINGKATFIPYAILGETVRINIIEEKKAYNRAMLMEIIEPSPYRIEPICPHYYECGGCSYQHIDYKYQLELKRQAIESNLSKLAKLEVKVNPVIPSDNIYRYRNKVTWHINNARRLGYYQAGTNNLLEIQTCQLISEKMEGVANYIRELLIDIPVTKESNLIIRESSVDGKIMLILTNLTDKINEQILEKLLSKVEALFVNYAGEKNYEKLIGLDKLKEKAGGAHILLSPGAFFQVNHGQMEKIINLVEDYLDLNENDVLLDAYSGVGSLSLALANKVKRVIGIESFAPAIDDAKNNATLNNLNNCEFLVGYSEKVLPRLNTPFNKVIVDPPRSGLKREVIEAIAKKNPEKIAYVSCNPATLARDLAIFNEYNYITKIVQPVDMFAQTYHVECVVLMSKVED